MITLLYYQLFVWLNKHASFTVYTKCQRQKVRTPASDVRSLRFDSQPTDQLP